MFIGIETILKDHGLNQGGGSRYAGFVETRALPGVTGTDVPLPTSHYNPTRDVGLVFVNGTYVAPSHYQIHKQETLRFNEALTGQSVSFIVLKTVKPQSPLIDGTWVEDKSIFYNKLSASLKSKLADPLVRQQAEQVVADVATELEGFQRTFAAIELFWATQDRVQGGTLFGDDFKTLPLGATFLDGSATLASATNSGQTTLLVADASRLRIGNEVTLYDNISFERRRITNIVNNNITLDAALTQNFKSGAIVTRSMGVRDMAAKQYRLPMWTDPVDNRTYELATFDVRYLLPENDRFVTWIETRDAYVDVKASYPTSHILKSRLATDGAPDIVWQLVTDATLRFETRNGFERTVVKYNGEVVADYGGGNGTYTHTLDGSLMKAGDNQVLVELTAAGRRASSIVVVEKVPVETYVSTTKTVKGDETQATMHREGVGSSVIRITFTRKNQAVRPTFRRLLGGIDRD